MKNVDKQAGSSLIQAMIAASVMGLIGAGYMTMQHNSIKASSKIDQRDDLVGMRRALRAQVDCKVTLTGTPCTGAGFFPLKSKDGRVVGSAGNSPDDWKIGKWNFRASCASNHLNVQVSRLKPGSTTEFMKDPLTLADQSWKDLFLPGDLDCANFFAGLPPCPAGQSLTGIDASGQPICYGIKNFSCGDGKMVSGFDSKGNPVCVNVPAGGGRYMTYICTAPNIFGRVVLTPAGGGCRLPNTKTGGCSCPSGFAPVWVSDSNTGTCPQIAYESRGMMMWQCD